MTSAETELTRAEAVKVTEISMVKLINKLRTMGRGRISDVGKFMACQMDLILEHGLGKLSLLELMDVYVYVGATTAWARAVSTETIRVFEECMAKLTELKRP